ncbi:MAG: hypothetical protein Q4B94_09150 [Pseudomonadota bacterium]|nr:hypothetical protein [Pseudomonadota bacterium]
MAVKRLQGFGLQSHQRNRVKVLSFEGGIENKIIMMRRRVSMIVG